MQKRCKCEPGTRWRQEAPESIHAYEVECLHCGKHIKWGKQTELNALIDAGEEGEVVDYKPPKPGPTLDAFFAKE